jgi:hypothetical protein
LAGTSSFAERYLAIHAVTDKIQIPPAENLRFIIVIPGFDEPALVETLESLWLCMRPASAVELIVVVNSAENADPAIIQRNHKSFSDAAEWAAKHNSADFCCHVLSEPKLPAHEAGPGLARKIGMDQAILRFKKLKRPEGIIISMDADSLCRPDYLLAIEKCFNQYTETIGGSIYFEHPLSGQEFPTVVYNAITEYELHLRYNISALRSINFPYAYHTIGSCFCVKASAYVNQGGMNKRKGGEDFYFLQKIIPLGNFREINDTCVYPSPRPSARAPFGTGTVITKFTEEKISQMMTYNPRSFDTLADLFSNPGAWYRLKKEEMDERIKRLPGTIREFCGSELKDKIIEINNNSSSSETFTKRFYQWFNMFRVIKYLNFVHQKPFSRIPVRQAAAELLDKLLPQSSAKDGFREMTVKELLEYFRKIQKEGKYNPNLRQ